MKESRHPRFTTPNRQSMQPGSPFPDIEFRVGELYLFHTSDRNCPPESSLWGMFDHLSGNGAIGLESSSEDLVRFRCGGTLPAGYRYCRLSSRDELRDYTADMTFAETESAVVRS